MSWSDNTKFKFACKFGHLEIIQEILKKNIIIDIDYGFGD